MGDLLLHILPDGQIMLLSGPLPAGAAGYRFMRDEVGSRRMQFIPIVEPVGFRLCCFQWITTPSDTNKFRTPPAAAGRVPLRC